MTLATAAGLHKAGCIPARPAATGRRVQQIGCMRLLSEMTPDAQPRPQTDDRRRPLCGSSAEPQMNPARRMFAQGRGLVVISQFALSLTFNAIVMKLKVADTLSHDHLPSVRAGTPTSNRVTPRMLGFIKRTVGTHQRLHCFRIRTSQQGYADADTDPDRVSVELHGFQRDL